MWTGLVSRGPGACVFQPRVRLCGCGPVTGRGERHVVLWAPTPSTPGSQGNRKSRAGGRDPGAGGEESAQTLRRW